MVEGVTEEEMKRLVDKQRLKQQMKKAGDGEEGGAGQYTTNKEKRSQIKADFYMF